MARAYTSIESLLGADPTTKTTTVATSTYLCQTARDLDHFYAAGYRFLRRCLLGHLHVISRRRAARSIPPPRRRRHPTARRRRRDLRTMQPRGECMMIADLRLWCNARFAVDRRMVARAAAWFPCACHCGWSPISMSSRHHSEARGYSPLVCRLSVLRRGWGGAFVGPGGVCVNRLCQHHRRSGEVDSEDATARANRVAKRVAAERYFQRTGNSPSMPSAPRVRFAPPPRPAAPVAVTRPPRAPAAARPPAGDGGTTSASGAAARSDGGSGSGSGGASSSSSGSQVHDCVYRSELTLPPVECVWWRNDADSALLRSVP